MIDTYDKLTLRKWAQLAALDGRTFEDDISRQVAVLAILADRSEREILSLPLPEYAALVPSADFLFTEPTPSNITGRGFRTLKLGSWVLVPTTDIRKLTTAQYIDFQTMLAGGASVEALLSCFLVPEGKTYCEGYEIGELHDLLADALSVRDALALKAFFLRRFRLNDSYPNLLQMGDNDRTEEGEEGDEGEAGGGFAERWGWLDAVRQVSDTTHERWTEIWRQPMAETLTILAYIKDKNDKEAAELERQRRKYGR